MVGIMRAGGAYVPLDPKTPDDRLLYLVEQCMCVAVVVQRRFETHCGQLADICSLLVAEASDLDQVLLLQLQQRSQPQDLAYVLFTSGSTGMPKGVAIQHSSLMCFVSSVCPQLPDYKSDHKQIHLYSFSFTFDPSVLVVWCAMHIGSQLCIIPPGGLLSIANLYKLICKHLIAVLDTTPAILNNIFEGNNWIIPAQLEYITLGGSKSEPAFLRKIVTAQPKVAIFNQYGPTESTVGSHEFPVQNSALENCSIIPIGTAMPGSTGMVLDEHLQHAPVGITGELFLGGQKLARGYVGRADLTAKTFRGVKHSNIWRRLYATGDRVRWLPSGDLEFQAEWTSRSS